MQFPQKAIYLHFALHKEVKIDLIKKKKRQPKNNFHICIVNTDVLQWRFKTYFEQNAHV